MVLKREAAAYRAWKEGVVHTTLNPKGPGAVRIHLIPPKYRPFGKNPYAMILNGYYILPLGYSWAVLLGNFIREVNRFDGRPMDEKDMEKVVTAAVDRTGKSYRVPEEQLRGDLEEMLVMLYGVACGEEPSGEIEPLSLREYAPHMTAPHRMDLMVSAMTKADGGWNCNLQCRHCYAAGQPEAEGKELNTEQWKKIIDRLKSAGVPQVTFTGGEPTLRRDLVELVLPVVCDAPQYQWNPAYAGFMPGALRGQPGQRTDHALFLGQRDSRFPCRPERRLSRNHRRHPERIKRRA